jgi:hypothetical protein
MMLELHGEHWNINLEWTWKVLSYFVQKLLLSGQLYGKKGSHFSDRQSAVKEKQCNVLRKIGLLPPYRETKI